MKIGETFLEECVQWCVHSVMAAFIIDTNNHLYLVKNYTFSVLYSCVNLTMELFRKHIYIAQFYRSQLCVKHRKADTWREETCWSKHRCEWNKTKKKFFTHFLMPPFRQWIPPKLGNHLGCQSRKKRRVVPKLMILYRSDFSKRTREKQWVM